jgi:hypothetical protein
MGSKAIILQQNFPIKLADVPVARRGRLGDAIVATLLPSSNG